MEFRLTFLILLPLGLTAAALYAFALRPMWAKTVSRLQDLDAADAAEKRAREEAERELQEGQSTQ